MRAVLGREMGTTDQALEDDVWAIKLPRLVG